MKAKSVETPSRSRIDQAKRYALQNFDQWNEVTGFVQPHCGYYCEITSLIRDAVEFGFGVAHGQTWRAIRRRLKAVQEAEIKACVIEAGANPKDSSAKSSRKAGY